MAKVGRPRKWANDAERKRAKRGNPKMGRPSLNRDFLQEMDAHAKAQKKYNLPKDFTLDGMNEWVKQRNRDYFVGAYWFERTRLYTGLGEKPEFKRFPEPEGKDLDLLIEKAVYQSVAVEGSRFYTTERPRFSPKYWPYWKTSGCRGCDTAKWLRSYPETLTHRPHEIYEACRKPHSMTPQGIYMAEWRLQKQMRESGCIDRPLTDEEKEYEKKIQPFINAEDELGERFSGKKWQRWVRAPRGYRSFPDPFDPIPDWIFPD